VSPNVGSAVCTSTGEVGRGAIKVMGPSAVLCLADFSVTIEIDHSVWKQSYNACPNCPVYSIDIGSVSVFTE